MSEIDTYEINPNVGADLREKPLREQSFQERREAIVERKIEDITTQIASNMRANLDPEIANPSKEVPLNESPLSLDVLGQYFGNVEVNPQEKAPVDIYPYGEFDYKNISIQELDEDFTPEKLVSTLLWSSAMLKLPVETYKSSMDLQNFRITPEIKEEILRYVLKKDNKEVSDAIKVISKQPPENITDEDIEYLVKARKNRGGITKEDVNKEASRVREQIKPLLLEDKWENLPPEVLSHVLSIGAKKETVELGDLVSEVYPVFDTYRDDINEALKLAFLDREEFIKKYVESNTVRERFDRFVSDLRNKVPRLSYKTAMALGSMALIVAACSPIVSSTPVGVVPGGSEIAGETIVLETEEETSPTPIVTETSSPTPSPIPIQTEAPEPTAVSVREQYPEDVTKESTENTPEFGFLDPSIGSGLENEGESAEFVLFESREEFEEIVPSVEELREYKFVGDRSHKKEGTPVRVNSNMLTIISFPVEENHAWGNELRSFSLETEELKEVMNSQRKVDWTYRYDELEGFAFEVDSFVSLVGPKGDLIEFGKVRTADQNPLYLLTKYIDANNKEYKIGTLDWAGYRTQNFGEEKNMTSFSNFTTNFYNELNKEENTFFTGKKIYEGEIKESLFNLLYESPKLRELEIIAEHNRDVKVVLGISNAINDYMLEFGGSGDYDPDSFVKYVFNHTDSGGNSWYKDFFEMHMDWFNYTIDYENELDLKKDLEVVLERDSNGLIRINKYKLFNIYSKLVGLRAPHLDRKIEGEIENRILQKDFNEGSVEISQGQEVIGYLYEGAKLSMDKVVPGDILFPDWLIFKSYHSREKDGSFNLWVLGIEKEEWGDRIRLDSINSRKGKYLIDFLGDVYLFRSLWWKEILLRE